MKNIFKTYLSLLLFLSFYSCTTSKNTIAPPKSFISEFGFYKGFGIDFNSEYATYLPNEKQVVSKIKSILVETKKTSNGSKKQTLMPFIVNLYAVDSIFKIPTTKLISDRIIAQKSSSNKVEVDISKYNINFPKEGIFVTVEPLKVEEYIQKGFKYNVGTSFKYLNKISKKKYFTLKQTYDEKGKIISEWGTNQFSFVYNFGIKIE